MRNNRINKEEKIIYTNTFIVRHSDTLLEFLLKKMNTSRNNVKSLLSNKQVLINGSVISQFDYPLAKDDEIKISKNPIRQAEPKRVPKAKRKVYSIEIIYEDEDFIAINKPAGLLAVESDNEREETAYNYMQEYLNSRGKNLRPYIIHRIDKETSGVLVFAKNPRVHSQLKLNWNDFVLTREYIAVIDGNMPKNEDTLVNYLTQGKNNLVYVTKDESAQKSITHYKVIKTSPNYQLLRVLIDTGRKNQIRVQLSNQGHPIVGDDKYKSFSNPLKRLGLHASILEFKHPFTNETIKITAKTPTIFYNLFV